MDKSNTFKKRNSQIEILRIISIIAIVLSHACYHSDSYIYNTGFYQIYSLILIPLGKLFFCVFSVISCWYLTEYKFKSKKFFLLWFQTIFYNIVLLFFAIFYFKDDVSFTTIVKSFLPILGFGTSHGYIAGYLGFLLILPLEIIVLKKISVNGGIVITICTYFLNMFLSLNYVTNILTEILFFTNLFALTCIIKKIKILDKIRKYNICYLLVAIICFFISVTGWILKIKYDNIIGKIIAKFLINDERCIINIIFGFSIFLFFLNLKPFSNKVINLISGCTLDILLIHDTKIIRNHIWNEIFNVSSYYNEKFILWSITVMFLIIFIAFIIYVFRKYVLERLVFKLRIIKKICFHIDYFYENEIENYQKDKKNNN